MKNRKERKGNKRWASLPVSLQPQSAAEHGHLCAPRKSVIKGSTIREGESDGSLLPAQCRRPPHVFLVAEEGFADRAVRTGGRGWPSPKWGSGAMSTGRCHCVRDGQGYVTRIHDASYWFRNVPAIFRDGHQWSLILNQMNSVYDCPPPSYAQK